MLDVNEILNSLSELVYISDVDTYELLYMNEASRKIFNRHDSCIGKPCYQVLQGKDSPCSFCTNSLLSKDEFYTWEIYNKVTNTYYLLKDKLIEYNGKAVRFEIATDISELKNQNALMENLLAMDDLLIKCVTKLHENISIQTRINTILKATGEFLNADRVYIFEKSGDSFNNIYEWCNEHVASQINNLQKMDSGLFNRWMFNFDRNECVIIEDIENIKATAPDEYQILTKQDIHSLVAAPLKADGKFIGCIGIDNPPKDKLKHSPPFFSTIGYFLSSIMAQEETEKLLRIMSYRDSLTGLHNRNKFINDIDKYNHRQFEHLGVIYVDINGLKEINDMYGHIAGDNKLIRLSHILKSVCEEKDVYRIGGDEFCVISTPIDETVFNKRIAKLREFFSDPDDCSASIGFQYTTAFRNLNEIIKEADKMMYDSKKNYYKNKISLSRYRQYD